MRVEELAGRAGVSVDTVRFYQKQRLLPPPVREGRVAWYTGEHLARMARVKELRRRGFTLAVIRRFLDGELDRADEPLVAAVSEAVVGSKLNATTIGAAADAAFRPAKPTDNTDFTLAWRKEMVRVYVQRALEELGSGLKS